MAPVVCIEFELTISPLAQGVVFIIYSTQIPLGAVYTQVDCADSVVVGDTVFLSSTGPHHLTFCKPGNNSYQYGIQSIPGTINNVIGYELNHQINVYPNPTTEFIVVESESALTAYKIIDVSGNLVGTGIFANTTKIDLRSLSPGIYFLECRDGNYFSRNKIIRL